MFIAAFFTGQEAGTTQVSSNRQMHRENVVYTHTMENYSAFKKEGTESHAVKGMNLVDLESESRSVVSNSLWPQGLYMSTEFSRPEYWSG